MSSVEWRSHLGPGKEAVIGYWPNAVYIGPFLVLVTAAATGLAFFLDNGVAARD